jgi:hypothetical protein
VTSTFCQLPHTLLPALLLPSLVFLITASVELVHASVKVPGSEIGALGMPE